MNKILSQDATNESLSTQNPIELSPLAEKTDESAITVDVNHDTKQITVEVLATSDDTLSSPLLTLVPELKENASRSEHNVTTGLVDFVLECENSVVETDKSQALNQLAEKSLGPTASVDVIDKSYETPINASISVQLTPIADKRNAFGKTRTPIGMIRLRQTMNSMNVIPTETFDDNSAYEIFMVNKYRNSPMKKVRFSPVDRIIISTNENHADDTEEAPIDKVYPLSASNAIASKMTAINQRFPTAPNMILDRIHLVQEYNRRITMQNIARVAADSVRMQTQQTRKLTKGKNQISC